MAPKRKVAAAEIDEEENTQLVIDEDFTPPPPKDLTPSKYVTEEVKATSYTFKTKKGLFSIGLTKDGKSCIYPKCLCGLKMANNTAFYVCSKPQKDITRCGLQIHIVGFKMMVQKGMIVGSRGEPEEFPKSFKLPWCDKCNFMSLAMCTDQPHWTTYMIPAFRCNTDCPNVHTLFADKFEELDETFDREVISKCCNKKRKVKKQKTETGSDADESPAFSFAKPEWDD